MYSADARANSLYKVKRYWNGRVYGGPHSADRFSPTELGQKTTPLRQCSFLPNA